VPCGLGAQAARSLAAQLAVDKWQELVEGGPLASGHFLPEEAPDEVLQALVPFLSR
jgi:haloacetate dehalogenase